MLRVKHLEHFTRLNDEHGGRGNRGSCSHTNGLTCQRAFTKEVTRPQNGDNRLFANFINDGELHTATLQIHYATRGITLSVDAFRPFKLFDSSRHASRIKKSLGIESEFLLKFYIGFDLPGNRGCPHRDTT